MKKLSFIFALVVLALFTQCKKQDPTQDTPTNGIQMVLKADNGGSRTSFGPGGAIAWSANDKIYVVANGQCVGHVTNGAGGGSTFTGTLSGITASGTYDFHYYYVGTEQTIADEATSFTMDFSDQDGTLVGLGKFHVGYGTQTGVEVTPGETVTAQATMKTLVAMAYFDLAGMAEAGEKVFFYGEHINNQLSIDFSDNTPAFGKVNEEGLNYLCAGTVTEGATSPCYVMLLPNHTDGTEELATDISFVSKRTTGTCNDVFNYGIIGGRFYCAGGNTDSPIAVSAAAYDEGTLRGLFSVSSGTQVRFSQGNLQYIGSAASPYWQFAENQWDYLGANGQGSTDLFGWGTSGYNHGAVCYLPTSRSTNTADYYAYGDANCNLYDGNGTADWGYNAISNGGNTTGNWRTLRFEEGSYLFSTRSTASGIRFAKANVNGKNGVILLSDDWNVSIYLLNNPNDKTASFSSNTVSSTDWLNVLEPAGAVFLPVAGGRSGSTYSGNNGYYWTAKKNNNDYSNAIYFTDSNLLSNLGLQRYNGCSVRVIRNVE